MIVFMLIFVICIAIVLFFHKRRAKLNLNPLVPNITHIFPPWYKFWSFTTKDLFNLLKRLSEHVNDVGGAGKFSFGPLVFYLISDAEDAATVLTKCMEKMPFYKLIVPYVGKEIAAAEVPVWKRNRKILDLAFKQNILDQYMGVFNSQADKLVEYLREDVNKGPVDLNKKITRAVLEAVCQTSMGLRDDSRELVSNQYLTLVFRVINIVTRRVLQPWYTIDFLFNMTSLKKEMDDALKTIWGLSDEMVAKRKQEYLERLRTKSEFNYKKRKFISYLDAIIENSMTENSSLYTDIQLRNLVDNMVAAGFDTTTHEILFTLLCIGTYPDVQEKVYQEVINAFEKDDSITKDDLSKLVYMEAVIKETIRLYPAAMIIARRSNQEVQLRNFVLPAGIDVVVSVWSVNRNRAHWGPDADEFRPERWLTPGSLPDNPAAFASFSPGRRNCIGRSYAITLMKTMLSKLIRRYRFTADHRKMKLQLDVILQAEEGNEIALQLRNREI